MSTEPAAMPGPIRAAAETIAARMDLSGDPAVQQAVDPTSLIRLLSRLLIQVIQACPRKTPSDLRASARRPNLLERNRLARLARKAVRAEYGTRRELGAAQFRLLEDESYHGLLAAASRATVAEIGAVRDAALAEGGEG